MLSGITEQHNIYIVTAGHGIFDSKNPCQLQLYSAMLHDAVQRNLHVGGDGNAGGGGAAAGSEGERYAA